MIYLDNSATTRVRPEVVQAMVPYLSENWGNPSSIHSMGRAAKEAVTVARQQVSRLLNCDPDDVYFSACGTMSNNVALLGRARFAEANSLGRHLITTMIEHPSMMGPAQYLESCGWQVTYLPVDKEGFVHLSDLEQAIRPETSIISIMWANNEIGTIEPIKELATLAHERGIYFHTDAVQVPGKLPIDLQAVPVSSLALSGHKFYAPKGVGILFLRKGQNVMPIMFGGGQEKGLLPGTEGLANIVAIGKAAELAFDELAETNSKLVQLQKFLFPKLEHLPGVHITGTAQIEKRLPGHLSFVVDDQEGEALVMRADLKGICIASGSACHHGIIEPSSVLKAIGLPAQQAKGSIRISIGRFNTEDECELAAKALVAIFRESKASASVPKVVNGSVMD